MYVKTCRRNLKWFESFNDGKDAHHILPQQTLKRLGLNTNDAPAIILPKDLHERTISHRGYDKGITFKSLRHEVEVNIQDVVKILKDNRVYSQHIESSMRQAMDSYMAKYPNIFK